MNGRTWTIVTIAALLKCPRCSREAKCFNTFHQSKRRTLTTPKSLFFPFCIINDAELKPLFIFNVSAGPMGYVVCCLALFFATTFLCVFEKYVAVDVLFNGVYLLDFRRLWFDTGVTKVDTFQTRSIFIRNDWWVVSESLISLPCCKHLGCKFLLTMYKNGEFYLRWLFIPLV